MKNLYLERLISISTYLEPYFFFNSKLFHTFEPLLFFLSLQVLSLLINQRYSALIMQQQQLNVNSIMPKLGNELLNPLWKRV